MFVRTMCYPVTVLGPGKRLGVWLSGCSKRCPGCMSPELQERRQSDDVALDALMDVIAGQNRQIDGVTVSGGEPFEQAEELCGLLAFLHGQVSQDILVYTGWTFDEVKADPQAQKCLPYIATLIDGEYVESLNDGVGLRGSSNQTVHRLAPSPEFDYEGEERRVQGFMFQNNLFTAGVR